MNKISLLAFLSLATFFPSAIALTNDEKTAWTGGYLYGVMTSACVSAADGVISGDQRSLIVAKAVHTYKRLMEKEIYSPEATPALYKLIDESKIDEVCARLDSIR